MNVIRQDQEEVDRCAISSEIQLNVFDATVEVIDNVNRHFQEY